MVIPGIVILPLLLTHVLSAPSGCIESCGSYVKQYQTQSSGSFQNQGATRLQGLDYSRPGTWSEHNDYDINNGHGKVHEEQGQVVDGSKTVRYYKKNYTSSYSTGYSNGEGLSEIENQNSNYGRGSHVPSTEDAFNSQRTYNQVGNSESIAQHKYNRIQNQQQTQSSIQRTNAQSERLEDFGEYSGNSQVVQGASDLNTQTSQEPHHANGQSGNWSKVDSYNTDGGRGRVFEEEGQYLSGPKKVRYYKRNYTSTYSSTGGIPIPEIDRTGVSDIHNKIENLHREVGKEFNQISTTGNVASTNLAQTNINRYGLASDNTHNINSNTYRSRVNHESSLSSSQHNEEQHFADTSTERLPYRNPFPNSYGTSNFRTYTRHEGRIINHQPTEQLINPSSGYTNVLNSGRSGYNSNMYNAGTLQEQSEHLDRLRSSLVQNQMSDDNLWRNRYNQNSAMHSNTPGRVAHYKEHWSSSQTKESSVPEYSRDISQHNEQSAQYNNEQYEHQHRSHQALQDQDRHMYQSRGDSFNSAHQTNLGKLMTGALNLGQGEDTVDCAHETTEHVHSRSQYQRKYKRSIKHAESSEMQHPTGIHDLTQQTSGKLEFGQDSQQPHQPWRHGTGNQQSEDLDQQTGEFDDLTQQTSGKLNFGQDSLQPHQPWRPHTGNQHSDDLTQQTGEFDDLTQQTSGNLQFGQLSPHSNQPRRPGTGNQHTQDLTQQTGEFDDLTQQTSGNLQFGQLSPHSNQPRRPGTGNQHTQDLTQQTGEFDDLTQQTSGNLQFGQLSPHSNQPQRPGTGNQHTQDLTQQTGEFDDLTQQTSGNLQFGQLSPHSNQPRRPGTGNQYTQDLTQQTGEFDDLTQQTSGKLEFGQDSQQPHQPWRHGTGNQQSEDLDQQTGEFDDLTQQTSGKLEFGQDSQQPHQPWRPHTGNQHSDDLTQQTGEFDDLSQQTAGKLEFGQFSQQDNKDLSMEPHGATMHLPKPAGKPKPRSRYSRIGSMNNLQTENQNMHNTISQQTLYPNSRDISVQDIHEIPPIIVPASDAENIRSQNIRGDQGAANPKDNSAPNNGNQPSESNGFNIVGGDGDQVNLLHKSNDATVGVQWHYTYHPSDERPFVQQPDQDDIEDMQQQSSHSNLSDFEQNLDQQETQDKYQQWNNQDTEASRLDQQSQKYGSEWESRQQTLGQPEDQQKAVRSSETKHKLEPRILEAYGGGPYDAHHDDDIYNGVTINPGATLPPVNSADAWDIREKPREITATDEVTPPPMPVEPLANDTDEVAPPLSFWSRIGSKITTTFDKAKEKAKHIFGKK
ncbi:uncharacterized protein LOC143369038 isoform X7 [Andrena cerasifolii]|uniref:uncharacterized protein LOC143369038 isoform X7 n=1 Tax=Andrena cerasifolii TaxID=2819439 RepID=UPI004037DAB4